MIFRILIRLVSWGVLIYLAAPLLVIIGSSLTSDSVLAFPPQGLSLHWYSVLISDQSYISAFVTSTLLALVATVAAILLGLPAALAIARYHFIGRDTLTAVLMSPLVLPHIVLGAALLQFGAAWGLTRSFLALMIGHTIIVMPFVLRSVLAVMTPEQRSLEEASADLGARPLTTFVLVILPQIRSGLMTGSIFAFITSWINVELSMFNTTATLNTIPVKMFNYVQYTVDPTIAAVASVTILIAALVIILLDLIGGLDVLSVEEE